ncbi:MAG TPA: class I tRNA ligase family protein [Candidatus Dormibacteraeota bacterium]|nr:class I tRNA ligase family protein [Candidatus Dormibacteraeota bacterium]
MFKPVPSRPDLVTLEHGVLAQWRDRATFARLRAQNAGGEPWSFLDGPITANNPMGVHHAWGRTYKDLFQRFHAMLGEDQRWQNGFDCQGLWVEVNVERDLGFKSKRDIEAFGIADFVTLCKQRVLTYAARQTEQSMRLGFWMDWNDPDELRRLSEELGEAPWKETTIQGPNGPVTDTVEMLVGRLGMPDVGGSYFTFSNENNDLIWGFLKECHNRGWIYKGHDSMPWCPRCGTGISQHEMTEGYQDREDPGLTVRFPLVDRPGESLLVWTTTPWTLAANVAAAVGEDLEYVRIRQGADTFWLSRGTLKTSVQGRFEVLESRRGSELVGWRYTGPFDSLPAGVEAFAKGTRDDPATPYEHRVIPWDQVGEEEGTGIVHIAPGAGAEDFQLGKSLGLPVIGPIDEDGRYYAGFGWLTGKAASEVAEEIVDDLEQRGFFYHLAPYTHRYPHCWRCATPLLFRLVDEWFISMGEVYDQPRDRLTREQVDASLRYQIMEVVDKIRWIPSFGYERELDWLLNMHDWMISKKRYWGLALPIYDCPACGRFDVIGGRDELKERAIAGWERFEGHTPHRPYIDEVVIACPDCGEPVHRIADVGNPWLDAGIVPFSTLHYREDRAYWEKWFPADFVSESFPGQFRNWFYAMLAMSTVLIRERPFETIFGYATLFGEDGRPMHKSWGNSIEFDEAAERMGVDVMRWMYTTARPDDNILFGWHAADDARRELLVLWNVYAFFVTYARLAGWAPREGIGADRSAVAAWPALDRWILSRSAGVAAEVGDRLADYDPVGATRAARAFIDDLSTWYLRRSRDRMRAGGADPADREHAFATLHAALVTVARTLAPILPYLAEDMYQNLVADIPGLPDSVHLTRWPAPEIAALRDEPLEASMAVARRAVDLARTLRAQVGLRTRQPLARAWLAIPDRGIAVGSELLELIADEINVKVIERIDDESTLVDRRVKPLLPKVGKRLGPAIPAVMAAAREGDFVVNPDGSVTLGGATLAADEVEILATPRAGTAVAHDEGLVVVIDTEVTPALRAEGDARELQRAVQDLRKGAGLDLDARIELWVAGLPAEVEPHLASVARETLAVTVTKGAAPEGSGATDAAVELTNGTVTIAIRGLRDGSSAA